jgi:hypothetical protein
VSETISDLPVELQDVVSLMVSELATNALVHASSGFDVAVDRSDSAITISITDRGDGIPAVQSPDSSEPHGRGLRIVEVLSDSWGINESSDTGKTVWFRLSLDSRSVEPLPSDTSTGTRSEHSDGAGNPVSRPSTPLAPEISGFGQPDLLRNTQPPAGMHARTPTPVFSAIGSSVISGVYLSNRRRFDRCRRTSRIAAGTVRVGRTRHTEDRSMRRALVG